MAGGAAEVRLEHHVAAVGQELRHAVEARPEVVDRPAMHVRDERCVRGVHARWQQHEAVHAPAVGRGVGNGELARQRGFFGRTGGDAGIVQDAPQPAVARVVQVPARIAQGRRAFAHQPPRGGAAAGLQADVAAREPAHDIRDHRLGVADAVGRGDGAAIARRQRLLRARVDHHFVEIGFTPRVLVQCLQPVEAV